MYSALQQRASLDLDWRAITQGAVASLIAGLLLYLITQKRGFINA